jgi:hypothetical protein
LSLRKILDKAAENWPAKVFSIALAMVLFVFHQMNSLGERFFSVPLVLESQANLVPAGSYPRMIRISLRGDPNNIYSIQEEDIQAYIDISRFSAPGNYQAAVQIRKTGMALEIMPLEIRMEPGEVSLSLDQKDSKYVPIKINFHGEAASGYLLDSYNISPSQVIIEGPSAHLNNTKELNTELVDLSGRSDDFTVMVNILNQDPLITIRGSGVTEFSGFITRLVSVRNIQNVPIRIIGLNELFSSEPESRTANLRLEGRNQEDLDDFVLTGDFLFVDCSAISEPGDYILKIEGGSPNVPMERLIFFVDPPEMKITINPTEILLPETEIPETELTETELIEIELSETE